MLDALEKSVTNAIKKRGPRIEPWGTPCVINFVSDLLLLYITNWDLFVETVFSLALREFNCPSHN